MTKLICDVCGEEVDYLFRLTFPKEYTDVEVCADCIDDIYHLIQDIKKEE